MTEAKTEYKWVGKRTPRPDGDDKVTGRATFGADFSLPGMLVGKVLRSPHPHANILSIDLSRAEALDGVKAAMCARDLVDFPVDGPPVMVGPHDLRFTGRNVMAREKVFYAGHAVAAVAATSARIARKALALIEVEYEVLPHVIDVREAMAPGAPVLHDFLFTDGVDPKPDTPSNVAKRMEFAIGDLEVGFAEADVIIEREYTTKPVHQGYLEPHSALVSIAKDGQATIWSSSFRRR